MKKLSITIMVIFGIVSNSVFAQEPDSVATLLPLSSWGKMKQKLDRFAECKAYKMSFIGVPLIVGGLIVKQENDHFRSLRNSFAPSFDYHYDDYFQYAPLAFMLVLKTAGVEGRSSWPRMLVADAFSAAIMAVSVNLIKSTNKTLRPDGSTRNSFPSGHSATAFMAATMLHKEYGMTRSPWYSIAGYTVATATAIGRQLNNRHWLSDVMVGAGIGILSTELGYYLADLIFKQKGITREYLSFDHISKETPPSFFGYYLGFTMFPGFNFTVKNIKLDTATGSSAGFEGAWFFNPYIGIGGRLRITNVPVTLDSEHYFANHDQVAADESIQPAAMDIYTFGAGAYFSYPFTNRWLFGSKLLFDSQYSPGDNIHAHSVQQADEGAATKEIIGIERFNTFGIGTGITATYIATQKLSVRFFTDYDFIPSRTKYRISDESGTNYYKNNRPIHALTLGAAVNIQF